MRILLVEDTLRLAALVSQGLQANGFTVDSFATLEDASAALRTVVYQVVVLDLGLPDGDGFDLLKTLRQEKQSIPVLILTARDGVEDRVRGLNGGADDYLVKPFAMEELVARIRALLRRPGASLGTVLTCGRMALDTVSREVSVAGQALAVPRRETEALELLLRRAGRVVPKRALEEGLYSFDDDISSNTVEVLLSRLRKRLLPTSPGVAIHTLRGVGYMLVEEEA
ncbi:response regulator [Insolitispirillum peregrinum]|uniref:DNA-binding response regulator, OmpR family, contains REC and winged-helix (WHTH) domain n=1 Tax=Insolitispirillum peregrinum TaxID=80876 RepID=A0A1N7L1R2_9PROT|nr:response regulator [Insolitispirillum peregrinum]SIS67803.1 DNA-binding response regulator, OmpR family, contains REC and winged-helix (wHTH) domain [Insolitispirillum peregrinum]